MVNVTCCGGQDRSTTTSSGTPERPPSKTRNCYVNEGQGRTTFDYMDCDGADTACTGYGISVSTDSGCNSCIASSGGGYCDIDGSFYSSRGMGREFHRLTDPDDIAELTKSSIDFGETDRLLRRYENRMNNRSRESEIRRQRNKSPSTSNNEEIESQEDIEETSITNYITDILLYIGVSATFLVMILSIILILLK